MSTTKKVGERNVEKEEGEVKKAKTDPLARSTTAKAIELINSAPMYHVVIVCTSDDHQAIYWEDRLSTGLCAAKRDGASLYPMVLAVSEDWDGGAGNGLGTLYAFQKAASKAKVKHGVDLQSLLRSDTVSAALYHTAGKGTRLAPLPGSENNNKPGVRLPATLSVNGELKPMTILEAVIKQTSGYSPSRRGRLSVFWGDQVFIPSAETLYTPRHHVDIMCVLGEMVDEETWKEKGLEKYGVIAVNADGDAAQVEKVDHPTAVRMLASLGNVKRVGPSLGSFSVSSAMLAALSEEFGEELKEKKGKFDTDPHFWMPMTLKKDDYTALMQGKGVDPAVSSAHYNRMEAFKGGFLAANPELRLFGDVDVGGEACWWDYGLLKLYLANNLKLIEDTHESNLLRTFLGVTSRQMNSSVGSAASVCASSVVLSSNVLSGVVTGSVLSNVRCDSVTCDGALLVNVSAKKVVAGKGCILYNLADTSEEGIVVPDGGVRVGIVDVDGGMDVIRSRIDIDGGKAWHDVVEGNDKSFDAIHIANKDADITKIDLAKTALLRHASGGEGR